MNKSEQTIEHIIQRMLTDTSVDAPRDAVTYAKNLYRVRSVEPKMSLLRRVFAVLQIDLAPNQAAFGERSASSGQARQMLFEAGDNAVDLRISVVDGRFEVRGQVLGEGFAHGEVTMHNDTESFKSKTDEMSEFTVTGIRAGDFTLTITGIETEILVEKLKIN